MFGVVVSEVSVDVSAFGDVDRNETDANETTARVDEDIFVWR